MELLLRNIIEPLLVRLGTAVAGLLVGAGLATQHGPTVAQAIVVVGLLAVDLITRKFIKR